MVNYYVALMSRSHAFLLERRLKNEGVICELAFMPREIMFDLCNMGVMFRECELHKALPVLRRSGLPGCRLFREVLDSEGSIYQEMQI